MSQQQHIERAIPNVVGAGPSSIGAPTIAEALENVILRHQVCYEVWPQSGCGARARRIGYCVNLCGVNDQVGCVRGHHVPGCPHCSLTYGELRKIAEWITLTAPPDCRFHIESFDRAWHIAPKQRWSRNEILVTLKILRSDNVDRPVTDSQERCLNELRAELKKLGVHEGVWPAPKMAAH